MEQLLQKTFKDLSDMTSNVVDRFFFARKIYAMKNEGYIAENDYLEDEHYIQYMEKVSEAFTKLNESERNLINNEFFFQSYNNWWESIYSKATFYRYKKKAMMKFLEAFYND